MKDLESILKKYSIPFTLWGTGQAKTLSHLKREINEKECFLIEENKELVRTISLMSIKVICETPKKFMILREEKQVFVDGRTRVRDYLKGSVSEKLRHNEVADNQSVHRALREELGVFQVNKISLHSQVSRKQSSNSFPGLVTRHNVYNYIAIIPYSEYKEEGYIEKQEDKITYFIWQPL